MEILLFTKIIINKSRRQLQTPSASPLVTRVLCLTRGGQPDESRRIQMNGHLNKGNKFDKEYQRQIMAHHMRIILLAI